MIAQRFEAAWRTALARTAVRATATTAFAAIAGVALLAATEPVRLVAVSAEDNAVVIEATEPVAYSVSRPDRLTLVLDLRNVSVSDARNDVRPQGAITGVQLEQATAVDGRSIARVRVGLARPSQYRVRSARNTIRVELTGHVSSAPQASPAPQPSSATQTSVKPRTPVGHQASAAPQAPVVFQGVEAQPAPATVLERIQSQHTPQGTTVTLSGNGYLMPTRVIESEDLPRRLVIDLPNVTSQTPAQTAIDSPLVKKIRVALNSHQPVVTRVVMEIVGATTYHMKRAGDAGRDFAVVFEDPQKPSTVMLAPATITATIEPEPAITLQQAIANAAPITPPAGAPLDPMMALTGLPRVAEQQPPPVEREHAPAPETTKPPAAKLSSAPSPATPRPPKPSPQAPPAQTQPPLQANAAPPATTPAPPAPTAPAPLATPPAPPATAQPSPAPAQAAAKPPAQPAPQQVPTPVPPQSTTGQMIGGDPQQRQFTGHPISMDFEGVDLRAVLRTFADVSGLNMVIDPDVQGTVDIKLTEVPWDQALDVILRGNQLDYTVDGTIVRIAKIETLRKEQEARQTLAKAAADAGTLVVRTFALSYAKAAEVAPLIKRAALSQRGDVQIDVRTNTLIITDLPARQETAFNLIKTIDRAEPQVEVEARIVQTTRDFARAIGVQWGLNGRVMPDVGNTTNLAFPNRGTVGGRLGTQGPTDPRSTDLEQTGSAIRLGVPDATTAIGLAMGAVNGAFNLDVALSALERTGKGRVLSTPRLTTQNNVEAEVAQGVQIPIQTVANNTVTVNFKDAVLTLRVTPQITAANTVIMKIVIENATADFSRQVNGIPPVDTQRANTQVQINDGSTTVIGGIFVSTEQSTSDKVPALHRIPILGWLFKQDRVEDESRELLIFITPRILKG